MSSLLSTKDILTAYWLNLLYTPGHIDLNVQPLQQSCFPTPSTAHWHMLCLQITLQALSPNLPTSLCFGIALWSINTARHQKNQILHFTSRRMAVLVPEQRLQFRCASFGRNHWQATEGSSCHNRSAPVSVPCFQWTWWDESWALGVERGWVLAETPNITRSQESQRR